MNEANDSILNLAGSLGAFVIIIWLYIRERLDSQRTIKEKDEYIKQINGRVLEAFEKNSQVNEKLQSTIEANTVATMNLTQRVTDALIDGKRGVR